MFRLICVRLIQLPFLLFVIYTITFTLAWMVPGNPLETEGRMPSKAIEQAMLKQYNLDNAWVFYWEYLGYATGYKYLTGDSKTVFNFGPSLTYEDWTVNDILRDALPVSIQLGAGAIIVALVVGVMTGVIGAVRKGSVADMATLSIVLIGISLPTFVTGSFLLIIFTLCLKWVPIGGVGGGFGGGGGDWRLLLLATVTLSLPFAAYIARLTRLGMIDVLSSDFIRTARAKGLSQFKVITKHALKVAFLPVLSFLGPAAAGAMTGSFVVEKVFNIPGMGQHFVDAVLNKDLYLIMGVVLVYATMLILFNLIVDIAYHFVDPRIEIDK